MSLNELFGFINNNSSGIWSILFISSLLVEIAPIKINPWSAITKWFSKRLTKDLESKIDENAKLNSTNYTYLSNEIAGIKNDITDLKEADELREAMTSRYRIIRAADEVNNGIIISDDHLDQLGEDIDIYDHYCETHPEYKNHKGQRSKQMIQDYEMIRNNISSQS